MAMRGALLTVCVVWLAAVSARGDEVHLTSGRVIEGATEVEGDRVIVAFESGKIVLPRQSVARIEQTRPASEEVRAREAALARDDVEGLLRLADFCRERDLRAKEHALLQRILRLSPDHEAARRRLGYVRGKEGWVTGPARPSSSERHAARREELETKKLELELEKQRAELRLSEARLERERAALAQEREERARPRREERPVYPSYYVAPNGPWTPPSLSPPSGPPPFPIPGVRSPHDHSFSLPGVREPSTYFGDALRR